MIENKAKINIRIKDVANTRGLAQHPYLIFTDVDGKDDNKDKGDGEDGGGGSGGRGIEDMFYYNDGEGIFIDDENNDEIDNDDRDHIKNKTKYDGGNQQFKNNSQQYKHYKQQQQHKHKYKKINIVEEMARAEKLDAALTERLLKGYANADAQGNL